MNSPPVRVDEFPIRELVFKDRGTGEVVNDILYINLEHYFPHTVKATLSTTETDFLRVKIYGEDAWQAIELLWEILRVEMDLLNRDYAIMYCGVEWDPATGDWPLGGDDAGAEDGA